jgi:hypothetical protein
VNSNGAFYYAEFSSFFLGLGRCVPRNKRQPQVFRTLDKFLWISFAAYGFAGGTLECRRTSTNRNIHQQFSYDSTILDFSKLIASLQEYKLFVKKCEWRMLNAESWIKLIPIIAARRCCLSLH